MGSRKTAIALLALLLSGSAAFADDTDSGNTLEASISADLVSSYIWRGQDCGGVSIQPGVSFGWHGISLSAWGSSGFEKEDTKEIDLTLSYTWNGLTAGITDYWFNNGPGYFHYSSHKTAHIFEAHVGYDFGPVTLDWFTNFAGNDGVTSKGKRAYSSYVEANAPFKIKGLDFSAGIGASPYATSLYKANGFSVINISLSAAKEFAINESCGLKVFAKGICNPRDDKGYILAGVSFTAF